MVRGGSSGACVSRYPPSRNRSTAASRTRIPMPVALISATGEDFAQLLIASKICRGNHHWNEVPGEFRFLPLTVRLPSNAKVERPLVTF